MRRRGPDQGYIVRGSSAFLFALAILRSASAHADAVEVQCSRMSPLERAELQARARLLLSSVGGSAVNISIECDAESAWLVWKDGSRAGLATTTNLVEAALDGIEDRLDAEKSTRGAPASASVGAGNSMGPPSMSGAPRGGSPTAVETGAEASRGPPPQRSLTTPMATPHSPANVGFDGADADEGVEGGAAHTAGAIDGGVSLATATEGWSHSVGLGPRLDVGIGLGSNWAGVLSEGARFATGGSGATAMVFDLQTGAAYGAPYARRTGLGVLALVGAERLATGGDGGMWLWSVTGSLGLRASVACGPIDLWVGADVLARSHQLNSAQDHIPPVAALLSLGFLVPAFSPNVVAHARSASTSATGL